MENQTTPIVETNSTRQPGKFFTYATHAIRLLLGLMFFTFGLNGVLMFIFGQHGFIPQPKEAIPPDVVTVATGLTKGGYMTVVALAELLAGLMLLSNRFVPLALALMAPIVVGIMTFHIAVLPATIGPGVVVLVLELYLAWAYRGAYRPMLAACVKPGV